MCRFCDAAIEFRRLLLFGGPSEAERNIEKLGETYQRLPVYLQLRVAEAAQDCGCSEQLAAVIGPLIDIEGAKPRPPPKPMF
jgi:hypothetical protein